jgi:hypothetical protein
MIETFKTILAQKEKPLGGICHEVAKYPKT